MLKTIPFINFRVNQPKRRACLTQLSSLKTDHLDVGNLLYNFLRSRRGKNNGIIFSIVHKVLTITFLVHNSVDR